jgi:hypothetical protein
MTLLPRKPEETSMGAPDSREHAVEPAGNFLAAKEKAMCEGVHSLTSEDIRGLSQKQIKELRGYEAIPYMAGSMVFEPPRLTARSARPDAAAHVAYGSKGPRLCRQAVDAQSR